MMDKDDQPDLRDETGVVTAEADIDEDVAAEEDVAGEDDEKDAADEDEDDADEEEDDEEDEDEEDEDDDAEADDAAEGLRVAGVQATWTATEPGEEGAFKLRLTFEDSEETHLLEVDSDDIEPILTLVEASDGVTFDPKRRTLSFGALNLL